MLASLERASITDNSPHGSLESTLDLFAAFAGHVIEILNVKVITRVGNRYIYTIECKSSEDARRKAEEAIPQAVPKRALFAIEPLNATPAFKLDATTAPSATLYNSFTAM